jgi:hypothetical protein
MYHTTKLAFGLRSISLLGGEILIFKALSLDDKTARYVKSQEKAVRHTIDQFNATYSHTEMYTIFDENGLIESVYRRNY